MDINKNIYNVLRVVELIQTKLLYTGCIDYESYFRSIGYEPQPIKEHEWILTLSNPEGLLTTDKVEADMNFILNSIIHNYNGRILSIIEEAQIDNPCGYLSLLVSCPSFFYKVLSETNDSIRVIM